MSDFKARMVEELFHLDDKIKKLREFVISDKFNSLPEEDRYDLDEQLSAMRRYYDILSRRLKRHTPEL